VRKYLRDLKYFLWTLNGFVGLKYGSHFRQKATVLITYYNPVRMKHINHQIRNILRCEFVGQIIVSNHNPNVKIESFIDVQDKRLTVLNQDVHRGCGYRWLVADKYSPEYLIVIDDDILIFPWQLKKLFSSLVASPDIPHGFAGMIHHKNDFLEYREKENKTVDYICEIYAITGEQLKRYYVLRDQMLNNPPLTDVVDFAADFVLISHTGHHKPKIHDGGRLFRCPTYNKKGIAVHQESEFDKRILDVAHALNKLSLQIGSE